MTILNGQLADQDNLNNAFCSKTANTGNEVTGKIDFNNSDADSGDPILNIQKEVNNKTYKIGSVTQVSSGGTVAISATRGMQAILLVSDGGNVTMNAVPFTATSFLDGTQLRLIGTSDTDSVTISHNDNSIENGVILNGSITLEKYVQITIMYVSSLARWIEIGRNK